MLSLCRVRGSHLLGNPGGPLGDRIRPSAWELWWPTACMHKDACDFSVWNGYVLSHFTLCDVCLMKLLLWETLRNVTPTLRVCSDVFSNWIASANGSGKWGGGGGKGEGGRGSKEKSKWGRNPDHRVLSHCRWHTPKVRCTTHFEHIKTPKIQNCKQYAFCP